ncbi:MAG: PDZ domain-containing protein [bacterium]|nr:PDZ domain-containing protein [bacterium]
MRTTRKITPFLLAALVVVPAWAGDDDPDHEKKRCTADAGVCVRGMVEKLSQKGWIGIEWNDEDEIPVLTQVVAGSPAEAAGLSRGDTVLAFNGVSTSAGEEAVWAEAKKSLVPGKTITLTIERAGQKKEVDVHLVALPRHVMAQWIGNHMLEHHVAEKDEEREEAEAPRP